MSGTPAALLRAVAALAVLSLVSGISYLETTRLAVTLTVFGALIWALAASLLARCRRTAAA